MQKQKAIYLDYNATTPLDPRVLEAMTPYFIEHFGNSASSQHQWGWTAERALTKARQQVAKLITATPSEIIFTSGSTEGNNWVLQSLFYQWQKENPKEEFHILSSPVEHSSVASTLEHLSSLGAKVEYVPVNSYGQVEASEVKKRIRPSTRLLSFIWANNEIGSLNPIQEIASIAKENKILFHSDATQAVGKVPVDLSKTLVDFMSFSSHKIYGPKGMGALYIRAKNPRVQLQPLIFGGGHEKGLRSGTVNVPGVVGFGQACEICHELLPQESETHRIYRDEFLASLKKLLPGVRLNGHPVERTPNNLNLSFSTKSLDEALPYLMNLGFSTGSACHSGSAGGSHVLKALGLTPTEINSSLRLSFGRFTSKEDLNTALQILSKAFAKASSSTATKEPGLS